MEEISLDIAETFFDSTRDDESMWDLVVDEIDDGTIQERTLMNRVVSFYL